jgi:ElaB/YqjD/DUF883 family membrane-anchored ribosome-binding protein
MARSRKNGKPATVNGIQSDLETLREDVTHLTKQIEALLTESGSDAIDDVKARLRRTKETVEDIIAEAGAKGQEALSSARDIRDTVVSDVEDQIREHPLTTVALAVGVGYLLSSLRR